MRLLRGGTAQIRGRRLKFTMSIKLRVLCSRLEGGNAKRAISVIKFARQTRKDCDCRRSTDLLLKFNCARFRELAQVFLYIFKIVYFSEVRNSKEFISMRRILDRRGMNINKKEVRNRSKKIQLAHNTPS